MGNVHASVGRRRDAEFRAKWRFNRTLRALVAQPRGIEAAAVAARLAPFVIRRLVAYAGDCGVAA